MLRRQKPQIIVSTKKKNGFTGTGERIQIQFPALTSSVPPVPGDMAPSSGLWRYCSNVVHRHIQVNHPDTQDNKHKNALQMAGTLQSITKHAKTRTMAEKMFLIVLRQESFIGDTVFKLILKWDYWRRRQQETETIFNERYIMHKDKLAVPGQKNSAQWLKKINLWFISHIIR